MRPNGVCPVQKENPVADTHADLWETFHAVSVGSVDYNRKVVEEKHLLAPEYVARTIRNFVENFFHCDECKQNFLAMYDSCGFNRCERLKQETKLGLQESEKDWREVPLWLFEVHNGCQCTFDERKG